MINEGNLSMPRREAGNTAGGVYNITQDAARRDCYRYFSACFSLPEGEAYIDYGTLDRQQEMVGRIYPAVAISLQRMREAASKTNEENLRVEFARLFIGPFTLPAPPYGSVYLEPAGRVMGDTTLEVITWYRHEGLTIDEDFKELPDHIVAELEFVCYLLLKKIQAYRNGLSEKASLFHKKQIDFFNGNIAR